MPYIRVLAVYVSECVSFVLGGKNRTFAILNNLLTLVEHNLRFICIGWSSVNLIRKTLDETHQSIAIHATTQTSQNICRGDIGYHIHKLLGFVAGNRVV